MARKTRRNAPSSSGKTTHKQELVPVDPKNKEVVGSQDPAPASQEAEQGSSNATSAPPVKPETLTIGNPKARLICRILLKDGGVIDMRDKKSVKMCKNLKNDFKVDTEVRKTYTVDLKGPNPDHIRFVIGNMWEYKKDLHHFHESDCFLFGKYYDVEEVLQIASVAYGLRCIPMMEGLSTIAGSLMESKANKEVCGLLKMTEEQLQKMRLRR